MQAAAARIAVALVFAGAMSTGCQEIQAVLGVGATPDAGTVAPAAPSLGRSIQGIPILAGAEVAYAGYLENDYQIELQSRSVSLVDAMRFYDTTLRIQGWQLSAPVADGTSQVVRGTRDGRILTARYQMADDGTSIQFLLVTAPAAPGPDTYAPIRDLAPAADGGAAAGDDAGPAAPAPTSALPDGVPQPTGYRLISYRALGRGSWEVVFEVDATADQAIGRLVGEMVQMGWRFGTGRAPVAAQAPDGAIVGARANVTVTIRVAEAARPAGGVVATLRLVGSEGAR